MRTKSDTVIRCRACGRFLPGEYREHSIHFCKGTCLDWFVKRRDLKQRLLPLETPPPELGGRACLAEGLTPAL